MDEQNTNHQSESATQHNSEGHIHNEPEHHSEVLPVPKSGWFSFLEKNFLALAILTSAVMVSGSVLYTKAGTNGGGGQLIQDPSGNPNPNVKVDVSIDDDPILGNKKAKVTIVEFSDYQCPFCRSFWEQAYPQIKKEYIDTGKVRLVYRDYPLTFHAMAAPSAEAAECADDQGKYWEMHDKIFAEQVKLGQGTVQYTNDDLKKWAVQIGLNSSAFNQCFDSRKYKAEVEKDLADGSAAGVTGTPSFFINGRLIVGAQPFTAFKAIIDEELKK